MSIKYKSVPMNFNPYKFANHVTRAMNEAGISHTELDAYVGKSVSPQIRATYARRSSKTYYPTMRTFVLICNCLDLDPREFFYLQQDLNL